MHNVYIIRAAHAAGVGHLHARSWCRYLILQSPGFFSISSPYHSFPFDHLFIVIMSHTEAVNRKLVASFFRGLLSAGLCLSSVFLVNFFLQPLDFSSYGISLRYARVYFEHFSQMVQRLSFIKQLL